jgi:hypothetical protein
MPQANQSNLLIMPPNVEAKRRSSTLRFYGEELVFDSVSGLFYRMNPTACFILRALDAGVGPRALPALLQARYDLDHANATRDVELFLNDLAALEPLNRLHSSTQAEP